MRVTVETQLICAYVLVWFLLMGGVRQIPELYRVWLKGGEADTAALSKQTGLSTAFFVAVFWAVSLSALIYGGVLLLREPA